jgi:hypothetical protein
MITKKGRLTYYETTKDVTVIRYVIFRETSITSKDTICVTISSNESYDDVVTFISTALGITVDDAKQFVSVPMFDNSSPSFHSERNVVFRKMYLTFNGSKTYDKITVKYDVPYDNTADMRKPTTSRTVNSLVKKADSLIANLKDKYGDNFINYPNEGEGNKARLEEIMVNDNITMAGFVPLWLGQTLRYLKTEEEQSAFDSLSVDDEAAEAFKEQDRQRRAASARAERFNSSNHGNDGYDW